MNNAQTGQVTKAQQSDVIPSISTNQLAIESNLRQQVTGNVLGITAIMLRSKIHLGHRSRDAQMPPRIDGYPINLS
jgi:hypothetical protein